MLIITLKEEERIKIGDNIEILIMETGSHRVRIGIDAPRAIPVSRSSAKYPNGKQNAQDQTQKETT